MPVNEDSIDKVFSLQLSELRGRVEAIEQRNLRVEKEKEWETSGVRIVSILLLTYLATCILFMVLGEATPLKKAVVPTLGFFLSTLSLPLIKRFWLARSSGKTTEPK